MSCVSGSASLEISSSSQNPSLPSNGSSQTSSSSNKTSINPITGYLKDHFNINFIDCKCCCDASKQVSRCETGTLEILRDIQEYIHLPEYRLNCRCMCGDERLNSSIKFGLKLTPSNDLK